MDRTTARMNEAAEHFVAANFDDAARIYDEMSRRGARARRLEALRNLGAVRMRQGRLDEARALFSRLPKDEPWLAFVQVLAGDLEAAEGHTHPVVQAFRLARRQRWAELDRHLTQSWDRLQKDPDTRTVRSLRLLWAWAIEATRPGDAAKLLDATFPVQARDLGYLCARWPELRAFLESRELI